MGIKDLNKLVKENAPNAIVSVPLSFFWGRRIAIDATNLLFRYFSTAWSAQVYKTRVDIEDVDRDQAFIIMLSNVSSFLTKLLKYGITPVFVFEGKAPVEKSATRQKRINQRNKIKNRISTLRVEISKLDILDRTTDIINSLRKQVKQHVCPTGGEIKKFESILQAIGIPTMRAEGEAEEFCSALAFNGIVSAVFSTDTDNLVYGTPIWIKEIKEKKINNVTGNYEDMATAVLIGTVLSNTNLTFEQFIDICIMSGCDYNQRIRKIGKSRGLGIKKCMELIREYGSIDNLPGEYDLKLINHVKCRQLFSSRLPDEVLSLLDSKLDVNNSAIVDGFDVLRSYGIEKLFTNVLAIYKKVPIPTGHGMTFPPNPLKITISILPKSDSNTSENKKITLTRSNPNDKISLVYLMRDKSNAKYSVGIVSSSDDIITPQNISDTETKPSEITDFLLQKPTVSPPNLVNIAKDISVVLEQEQESPSINKTSGLVETHTNSESIKNNIISAQLNRLKLTK